MDPLLLGTASAFGLAAATGLNASLPLLLVGLAARFGLITLVAPYDALGSLTALIGLGVLALIEIAADKVPGVDSILHVVQGPVTLAAGAIIFASQNSVVQEVSPGLAIVLGVLSAGGIHTLRALARPVVNAATIGFGGPVVSAGEDVGAVGLTILALATPVLAIALLAVIVVIAGRVALRRLGTWRRPLASA
jgi:Domain of unknown function (DUF4126)